MSISAAQRRALLIAATIAVLSVTGPLRGATVRLTVHCGETIVQGAEPLRLGINVSHLIGSDHYDSTRQRKLAETLADLGVRSMRWNEGETGDRVIWSVPPFERPDLHITYDRATSRDDHQFVGADGKFGKCMELDEALTACRSLSLELFVVAGLDAVWIEDPAVRNPDPNFLKDGDIGQIRKRMTDYAWAEKGKSARDMTISGTIALARYLKANARDIPVFLEMGNEQYLGQTRWKPAEYVRLVNELAPKIKEAHRAVKIGVQLTAQEKWIATGTDGREWNETVISALNLECTDFFIVHQYSFTKTQNIDAALRALANLPAGHRNRLSICVTETGLRNPPGVETPSGRPRNELFASLHQLRQFAAMSTAGEGRIHRILFWMTAWHPTILSDDPCSKANSAVDKNGLLLPVGYAVKLWNSHIRDRIVKVDIAGGKDIYGFASADSHAASYLALWLLNAGDQPQQIEARLPGFKRSGEITACRFSGKGPADIHPRLTPVQPPAISKSGEDTTFNCEAPPFSATVIVFGATSD